MRTNTGRNLRLIAEELNLNTWTTPPHVVRERLLDSSIKEIGTEYEWVIPDLESALEDCLERRSLMEDGENIEILTMYIEYLCTV